MSAADEPPRAGRRPIGLAVIALTVAAALIVSALNRSSDAAPPLHRGPGVTRSAPDPALVRDALARAVLQRQQEAVRSQSRNAYLRTWDSRTPATTRRAAIIFANLRALDVSIGKVRYVAGDLGGLPGPMRRRLGASAWTADVELAWRLRRYDARPAHAVLTFTFVRRSGTAYVADIAPAVGEREPIWLLGPLDVRRTNRTFAAASTSRTAGRLHALLALAVADVQRAVPTWHGQLVAYEPATAAEFESLLGAAPGSYDRIAAVTATVDGSTTRWAPVAVFVNPTVFDRLGKVGAHVVITHESTHAATGATSVGPPLWVAEGFADYVGVGAVDVPLSVSAGAVIRDIRKHGLPRSLPSNATFASAGNHLEVSYEQAWLAVRLIAHEYGKARLLAFYQRVVAASGGVPRALHSELGTSLGKLTTQWRTYLRTVASAA